MKLITFIKKYNIEQIKYIEEHKDIQFIALKKARDKIKKLKNFNKNFEKEYIYLIIQNALISYQLSWTGENRWQEFWELSIKYFENKCFKENKKRWYNILEDCRYNCRLANMKMKRIDKIDILRQWLDNIDILSNYYNNMFSFNNYIAQTLNQKTNAKTIVFATKMFAYACRIVFKKFVSYPYNVQIPIDSRLTKIYLKETWNINFKKTEISEFFNDLSIKSKIPPLHLDSILWIIYRNNDKF